MLSRLKRSAQTVGPTRLNVVSVIMGGIIDDFTADTQQHHCSDLTRLRPGPLFTGPIRAAIASKRKLATVPSFFVLKNNTAYSIGKASVVDPIEDHLGNRLLSPYRFTASFKADCLGEALIFLLRRTEVFRWGPCGEPPVSFRSLMGANLRYQQCQYDHPPAHERPRLAVSTNAKAIL